MRNFEKDYLSIIEYIQKNYSYIKHSKIKTSYLKSKSNMFKKVKNEEEFAKKLDKLLSKFNDLHLYVLFEGRRVNSLCFPESSKNYDYSLTKKYIEKFLFKGKTITICKINNTLYIHSRSWSKNSKTEIIKANNFFKKLIEKNNYDKIIFDVRNNPGGDSILAELFTKILIKKGKSVAVYKYRFPFKDNKLKVVKTKGILGFRNKIITVKS